ncbi:ATP-binding protein, partial [Flavihumibacter cheonanensis]|uniref:ATP-binding protein n=1 Tax=Flavihumibacter cheonanensis TaxID=1442385 RepID=UPI001EF8E73D
LAEKLQHAEEDAVRHRAIGLESALSSVPQWTTTFVGRAGEVEEVTRLVRANPLVTITGIGGMGKSRLAREVAIAVHADFEEGIAWVPLDRVAEERHV